MHEHAGETAQIEAPLAGHGDTAPAVTVDALAFHRMITACGETRELAAENPVQRDRDLVWDRLVARFRWAPCSLPNWRR
ncbi:hypothetical protein [Candidatus Poriferisodalis sp.]|uniref:hypothetical protein n=1 Tax=Candidatus Poriferisodalis sp. TaxID=3101277 RepID=UPI003B0253AE